MATHSLYKPVDIIQFNLMNTPLFNEHDVLHKLKHYLPAQASLKDFIHHNTLHAFQDRKFYDAAREASAILGYRVSLSLQEYREQFKDGYIKKEILERLITSRYSASQLKLWLDKVLDQNFPSAALPRIGGFRSNWKRAFRIDLDNLVHPLLFRLLCGYLDQGISMWSFPVQQKDFFAAIREMEHMSFSSLFRRPRAKKLLNETSCQIADLLKILVGEESLYEQYLFDQQFAHHGWSGMVNVVESQPETLLDTRIISIKDLIRLELLMEIDALDYQLGSSWTPLGKAIKERPTPLFDTVVPTELQEVLAIWQDAFEWTYYDQVLVGLQSQKCVSIDESEKSFQAIFCIDDRECSLRRYLEHFDANCGTFGTPGFFGVEFFFQPLEGKFFTKVCPAPITPKYLIKEVGEAGKREKDLSLTKNTHSLFRGLLISQTIGFWAAFKLMLNIFRPTMSPATATSFKHMDKKAQLTIENKNTDDKEKNLQVGFTIDEMATRMEGLLMSIGLIKDFAQIVYIVGHGSSSVNNPHYAAYDCGACSGRPGSVNSRVACYMLNHPEVRVILATKGIVIPNTTQFLGGLHDTTRDEIQFYDEDSLNDHNRIQHEKAVEVFSKSLNANAKERSRRLVSIDTHHTPEQIHEEVKVRSVSLFEPRPELNHATNTLCIVGRRSLTQNLFLDRRAFMNSYDYRIDPEGKYLLNILRPAAPVCGGINLEYFFSRVDNQKLGAGTKLPHNVMGLFGVANGTDGDLRPGLPVQMIEVHDPIRLLIIVEHFPQVVLETIKKSPETYEWFINEWVHLVAINPETHEISSFKDGAFTTYYPLNKRIETLSDVTPLLETHEDNLPVYIIS